MSKQEPKDPIIEAFRVQLEEAKVCLYTEAEVKIMLDRITYLENKIEDLNWDVMQASMGDDF